jgi:hypothetical protein
MSPRIQTPIPKPDHPAAPMVRAVAAAEHYRLFGTLPTGLGGEQR